MYEIAAARINLSKILFMEVQETWKYLKYRKPGNISSTRKLEISQVQESLKYLKYRKPGNISSTGKLEISQVQENWKYLKYREPGNISSTGNLEISQVQEICNNSSTYRKPGIFYVQETRNISSPYTIFL